MDLTGTGTSSNWITVSSYGSGTRRIIRNGNVSDRGIRLTNPDYWAFSNLEVGSAGVGILVEFTTAGRSGLSFTNIYVHDCRGYWIDSPSNSDHIFISSGIYVTGSVSVPSGQYVLTNVTMTNIEGTHDQDSVSLDWDNGQSVTGGGGTDNVLLKNLYLHDDNGPASGCADSLRFSSATNVTVMDSILNDEAACQTSSGTAAVFWGGRRTSTS